MFAFVTVGRRRGSAFGIFVNTMPPSRLYGPRDIYDRPGAIYNDILRFYRPSGRSVIARVQNARRRLEELRDDLANARVWVRERDRLQSERAYYALVIRALLTARRYLMEYIATEVAGATQRMRISLARSVDGAASA